MAFWKDIYFCDAMSPLMEQLIFFHDHAMVVLIIMSSFLFFTIINLVSTNITNKGLIENQFVELVWTVVPMLLVLFIAAPSLRLLYLMEETYDPIFSIKITGFQWYWNYSYLEFGFDVDSIMIVDSWSNSIKSFRMLDVETCLKLPVGVLVRMLMTSGDVIHSWSLPCLGVKMDCVPGRLNQTTLSVSQTGVFYGSCTEICGLGHSLMPIQVETQIVPKFLKSISLMQE